MKRPKRCCKAKWDRKWTLDRKGIVWALPVCCLLMGGRVGPMCLPSCLKAKWMQKLLQSYETHKSHNHIQCLLTSTNSMVKQPLRGMPVAAVLFYNHALLKTQEMHPKKYILLSPYFQIGRDDKWRKGGWIFWSTGARSVSVQKTTLHLLAGCKRVLS